MDEIGEYYEGKGCICMARSAYECGCCNADWTPLEVYTLRAEIAELKRMNELLSYGYERDTKLFEDEIAELKETLTKIANRAHHGGLLEGDPMTVIQGLTLSYWNRDDYADTILRIVHKYKRGEK